MRCWLDKGSRNIEMDLEIGRADYLKVEDEPRGSALADDVNKEVRDGKQPDIGAGKHIAC